MALPAKITRRIDPWRLVSVGLAGVLASELTRRIWSRTTGRTPPEDPSRADVRLAEAVTWTVAIGVTVGLARLIAGRMARRVADRK